MAFFIAITIPFNYIGMKNCSSRKIRKKAGEASIAPEAAKIAQVLACRKFGVMLKRELGKPVSTEKETSQEPVKCTFSKSAVVEFTTTVFESKAFYVNGQPATQEYVKKRTEQYFNIVVENFSELDNANRSRKGDITPFFTKLIECAISRAERLDGSNRLKKRRL